MGGRRYVSFLQAWLAASKCALASSVRRRLRDSRLFRFVKRSPSTVVVCNEPDREGEASSIERAGRYLLGRLRDSPEIPFSEFFDGSLRTQSRLVDGIDLPDDAVDWPYPERLMEHAIYQLEEQGFIKTERLTSKLRDGTPDFVVHWAPRGREMLSAGIEPSFHDAEPFWSSESGTS